MASAAGLNAAYTVLTFSRSSAAIVGAAASHWPDSSFIAADTGLYDDTVTKALRWLIDRGLVRKAGRWFKSNAYELPVVFLDGSIKGHRPVFQPGRESAGTDDKRSIVSVEKRDVVPCSEREKVPAILRRVFFSLPILVPPLVLALVPLARWLVLPRQLRWQSDLGKKRASSVQGPQGSPPISCRPFVHPRWR